jgi:hypothetical protein
VDSDCILDLFTSITSHNKLRPLETVSSTAHTNNSPAFELEVLWNHVGQLFFLIQLKLAGLIPELQLELPFPDPELDLPFNCPLTKLWVPGSGLKCPHVDCKEISDSPSLFRYC